MGKWKDKRVVTAIIVIAAAIYFFVIQGGEEAPTEGDGTEAAAE